MCNYFTTDSAYLSCGGYFPGKFNDQAGGWEWTPKKDLKQQVVVPAPLAPGTCWLQGMRRKFYCCVWRRENLIPNHTWGCVCSGLPHQLGCSHHLKSAPGLQAGRARRLVTSQGRWALSWTESDTLKRGCSYRFTESSQDSPYLRKE